MADVNGQPDKISSFQLKVSYWYVSHKLQLKQGLIFFLIFLSIFLYGYSIYKVSMILLVEDKDFKQNLYYLPVDLIDYSYFHQSQKPRDLQVLGFDSTDGREGRYDFIAKIWNPNPNFVAVEVTIQLISNGQVAAEKVSFLYPEEEKYVAIFGQEFASPSDSMLKISQVKWRRYREFSEFAEPRLKFNVSDIEFKPATSSGIRGQLPVSTLSFKITNAGAFSYWQVGVPMVLLGADRVLAANYISLDQFRSGEAREIEMRWYEPLSSVNKVEILPEVDILNPDTYMPVE